VNDDNLFGPGDDLADVPVAKKDEYLQGDFYLCPVAWADRAAEAVGVYLIMALRLYRRWRMRKKGAKFIIASSESVSGPGPGSGGRSSRNSRLRMLERLATAELIEILGRIPNGAYRVRIIEQKPSHRV
jgi:hypothetical protein